MATTSTQEYDNARQVDKDTLQSLNLKTDNNLDEYVLLIIGIDDDHFLSENLPWIIKEHCIKWFNDIETSLTFIHTLHYKNIFLIISGILGRDHVHKFAIEPQIVGLYVYCMDEDKHRMWTQEFNKIRCTVSDAKKLLTQLHRDVKELSGRWPLGEKSFQKATTSTSEWYHLFLLVICYRPKCIEESYKEMFNECRAYYCNNRSMIQQINQFQQTYKSDNAIYEYTRDSFLYRIVNHALRTKNMEIIRKFSPFIRDLHSQLHKYHREYYESKKDYIRAVYRGQHLNVDELEYHREYYKSRKDYIRAVYRGQHLNVDELEYLRSVSKSNNPVITLTTFSSTSLDPEVAFEFASPPVEGRIPCLFEIIIPDSYNTDQEYMLKYEQAFAIIASLSAMPREQEVLFSLVTRFSVEHVGYPIHQSNRTWVPIVLKLTNIAEAGSNYSHFTIIEWIEKETDPKIHADVLHMLQVNAEDELKFKSTNWQNWWNNLKRGSGKGLANKQPLHLIFYDCFTEDKYWARKAIELHKVSLSSIPSFQSNSSSFLELYREFQIWQQRPTIQIAIYEDYLKQFCTTDTKEVVKCLCLVGETYKRIADKESALECYQKALEMNVDDKYQMNNTIHKQIKILQKPPKTIRTTDNTERRSVKKDSNQESLEMYEAQQDLWLLYGIIKSELAVKFSISERLRRIFGFIRRREKWYDVADSKIILRLPYEITEDLSVNDYRYNFLTAVHTHISSRNLKMDAANNNSLSFWRYKKYMYEWLLCKELERFLQSFQNKSKYIRCDILPQLERLIKKLQVLTTMCTVYICIKQGEDNVDVNNVQFFKTANSEMRHPIYVDLRNSDLPAGLPVFEDKILATEGIPNTIPDHVRLISKGLADFMQSFP